MSTRPAYETDGTLHQVIGGILMFVAIFCIAAELPLITALIVFVPGVILFVVGFRKMRASHAPTTSETPDPPSATP